MLRTSALRRPATGAAVLSAILIALSAAVTGVALAGTGPGSLATSSVDRAGAAPMVDPTTCEECAECAPPVSTPTPPAPTPPASPSAATRLAASADPGPSGSPSDSPGPSGDPSPSDGPSPSDSPSPEPEKKESVNFTFRIWIDKDLKPSIDEKKVTADPDSRREAIDKIVVGIDKRNDCYTLQFDGPTTLECDLKNLAGRFFGDGGTVRIRQVSAEEVKRDDETVRRFIYRFQRMGEQGMYLMEITCKIPPR